MKALAARMRYTRLIERIAQSLEDQNDELEDGIQEDKAAKEKMHEGKTEMEHLLIQQLPPER